MHVATATRPLVLLCNVPLGQLFSYINGFYIRGNTTAISTIIQATSVENGSIHNFSSNEPVEALPSARIILE